MAIGDVKRDIVNEICWVQDLIEKCLTYYMTKEQIVEYMSRCPRIKPQVTEIVWQNLEEQNKEFFRERRIKLAVIEQIKRFNELLEKQAKLMSQMDTSSASTPLTNGSQFHSMPNNSLHQASLLAGPSEHMDQAIQTMRNVYANGASSVRPFMQVAGNMSGQAGTINVPENRVLVQSLNTEAMQGMNGGVIKSEQNTPETISGGNNGLPGSGDAFIQEPNSLHSCDENMSGSSMDSSGLLGNESPKNVIFSDLTDDFFTGVVNHYRSQFPDANFSDMQIRGQQQGLNHFDV